MSKAQEYLNRKNQEKIGGLVSNTGMPDAIKNMFNHMDLETVELNPINEESKPKIKRKKRVSTSNISQNTTQKIDENLDSKLNSIIGKLDQLEGKMKLLSTQNHTVSLESEKLQIIIQGQLFEGNFYLVEK
jgi:hypothetical protein